MRRRRALLRWEALASLAFSIGKTHQHMSSDVMEFNGDIMGFNGDFTEINGI
jgi:hypothetical protein